MPRADSNGTWAEQCFARMGWMSPTQRQQEQPPELDHRRCHTCDHYDLQDYTNRDGGIGIRVRCTHPMTTGKHGQATQDNAVCAQWSLKSEAESRLRDHWRS